MKCLNLFFLTLAILPSCKTLNSKHSGEVGNDNSLKSVAGEPIASSALLKSGLYSHGNGCELKISEPKTGADGSLVSFLTSYGQECEGSDPTKTALFKCTKGSCDLEAAGGGIQFIVTAADRFTFQWDEISGAPIGDGIRTLAKSQNYQWVREQGNSGMGASEAATSTTLATTYEGIQQSNGTGEACSISLELQTEGVLFPREVYLLKTQDSSIGSWKIQKALFDQGRQNNQLITEKSIRECPRSLTNGQSRPCAYKVDVRFEQGMPKEAVISGRGVASPFFDLQPPFSLFQCEKLRKI